MGRSAHGLSAPREDVHWSQLAPCKHNPELMFPHPNNYAGIEQARLVCGRCDHTLLCLKDGVARRDWHSVRGGHTGPERERLHRDGVLPENYPVPGHAFVWQQPRPCATCGDPFIPGRVRSTAKHCVTCVPPRVRRRGTCTRCGSSDRPMYSREVCEACQSQSRRAKEGRGPRVTPVCGSESAYERHRARREEPCQACTDFMRVLWRDRAASRSRVAS